MGSTSTETVTRTKLIQMAFRHIGESNPSNDDMANAVDLLNMLLKQIDIEGRWLWAISHTPSTIATVSTQESYDVSSDSIPDDIMELDSCFWMQTATDPIPMDILDKSGAQMTVNKDQSGQPEEIYLEKHRLLASQKLWIYPIPDGAYNIELYYRRRLYDFTAAGDNPDFPTEWVLALRKRLAYELAPDYGVPLQERNQLRLEADALMRKLNADAVEDAPAETVETVYF